MSLTFPINLLGGGGGNVSWSDTSGTALVRPDGTLCELPTVARAYRLATFGDSRAQASSNTMVGIVGSSVTFNPGRTRTW